MNEKTLEALRGSIEKWRGILAGTKQDEGTDNCPLCKLFYDHRTFCDGCPVSERTGLGVCEGSPYDQWCNVWRNKGDEGSMFPLDSIGREIATLELEFLESLLPDAERPREGFQKGAAPLCVFCSAPWTDEMVRVYDIDAQHAEGSYDVGPENQTATLEIRCAACQRLIYKKEHRA